MIVMIKLKPIFLQGLIFLNSILCFYDFNVSYSEIV